ncbi:MAG: glycosyltransferase family 4 protein [Ferruginibacter sp.]
MNTGPKIAIVVSHPIQHFCPQYVSFAQNKNCSVKVFFGSALGYKKYVDINFKQEISWSNLHLDKFNHIFLNGDAVIQADKQLDAATLEMELAAFQPDLVIVYGYFQRLQRRAYKWATKNKVPIAYISDSELRQQRNSLKEFIKSIFLRRYFSKISYFLSVGNANEAFYKKYRVSNEKIVRMHFPIDINQYRAAYAEKKLLRNKIRNQYGIGEKEIVVSVVGKLSAWKNQDHLIDAIQLLETKSIYLNALILGSGQMKTMWEQKAKHLKISKVYFPGFVDIGELPGYYAASDLYVHPASVEPHSIAVSEAIYMGCPVILSDRCGSYGDEDDVQPGKNGYTFEFGNIKQLAERISVLINDHGQRNYFGENSHKIAVNFQANAHHIVLEKLIGNLNKGGAHQRPDK